jgi:hypothetical protein
VTRSRLIERSVSAAILLGVAAGLVGVVYVKSGLFNVAASRPHSRAMEWITHETMINSVKRHATGAFLATHVSSEQAIRGFCQYEEHLWLATARRRWRASSG